MLTPNGRLDINERKWHVLSVIPHTFLNVWLPVFVTKVAYATEAAVIWVWLSLWRMGSNGFPSSCSSNRQFRLNRSGFVACGN
jgi:hypothetical protein